MRCLTDFIEYTGPDVSYQQGRSFGQQVSRILPVLTNLRTGQSHETANHLVELSLLCKSL